MENELKIKISIDNQTKEIKNLQNDFKNLNTTVQKSSDSTKDFQERLKLMGHITTSVIVAKESFELLNATIGEVGRNGFEYNKSIENSIVGLQTLKVATSSNISVMGKHLTLSQKYNLAQKEATTTAKELEKINISTPHTLNQTNEIYKAMYVSMKNAGASNKEMINLTEKISIAAGSAGIEFNSLLAGVDGLATGTVDANSDLGRFLNGLGLTNETLKESDDVVKLLENRLSQFKSLDTMAIAVSNLDNAWGQLAGSLTEDIFEDTKGFLNEMSTVITNVNLGYRRWQVESLEVTSTDKDMLEYQKQWLINQRDIIENDKYMLDEVQRKKIEEYSLAIGEVFAALRKLDKQQDALKNKPFDWTITPKFDEDAFDKEIEAAIDEIADDTKTITVSTSTQSWQSYYETIGDYSTAWFFEEAKLREKYIDLNEDAFKKIYDVSKKEYFDKFKEESKKSVDDSIKLSSGLKDIIDGTYFLNDTDKTKAQLKDQFDDMWTDIAIKFDGEQFTNAEEKLKKWYLNELEKLKKKDLTKNEKFITDFAKQAKSAIGASLSTALNNFAQGKTTSGSNVAVGLGATATQAGVTSAITNGFSTGNAYAIAGGIAAQAIFSKREVIIDAVENPLLEIVKNTKETANLLELGFSVAKASNGAFNMAGMNIETGLVDYVDTDGRRTYNYVYDIEGGRIPNSYWDGNFKINNPLADISSAKEIIQDGNKQINESVKEYFESFFANYENETVLIHTETLLKSRKKWNGSRDKWADAYFEYKSLQDVYFDMFSKLYDDFSDEGIKKLNGEIGQLNTLTSKVTSSNSYYERMEKLNADTKIALTNIENLGVSTKDITLKNFENFIKIEDVMKIVGETGLEVGTVVSAFDTLYNSMSNLRDITEANNEAIKKQTLTANSFELSFASIGATTEEINNLRKKQILEELKTIEESGITYTKEIEKTREVFGQLTISPNLKSRPKKAIEQYTVLEELIFDFTNVTAENFIEMYESIDPNNTKLLDAMYDYGNLLKEQAELNYTLAKATGEVAQTTEDLTKSLEDAKKTISSDIQTIANSQLSLSSSYRDIKNNIFQNDTPLVLSEIISSINTITTPEQAQDALDNINNYYDVQSSLLNDYSLYQKDIAKQQLDTQKDSLSLRIQQLEKEEDVLRHFRDFADNLRIGYMTDSLQTQALKTKFETAFTDLNTAVLGNDEDMSDLASRATSYATSYLESLNNTATSTGEINYERSRIINMLNNYKGTNGTATLDDLKVKLEKINEASLDTTIEIRDFSNLYETSSKDLEQKFSFALKELDSQIDTNLTAIDTELFNIEQTAIDYLGTDSDIVKWLSLIDTSVNNIGFTQYMQNTEIDKAKEIIFESINIDTQLNNDSILKRNIIPLDNIKHTNSLEKQIKKLQEEVSKLREENTKYSKQTALNTKTSRFKGAS